MKLLKMFIKIIIGCITIAAYINLIVDITNLPKTTKQENNIYIYSNIKVEIVETEKTFSEYILEYLDTIGMLTKKSYNKFIQFNSELNSLIEDSFWESICKVESNYNPKGYNKKDNTVGIAQISKFAIHEVNLQFGTQYLLSEMYDPIKSREVFNKYLYYCVKTIGCKNTFRNKALIWNGGPSMKTIPGYWSKVEREFNIILKNKIKQKMENIILMKGPK